MTRNTDSHFGNIPTKTIRRSKFKRPCSHKLTANVGQIIPIYRDELLPGDSCKINVSSLVRMTTPVNPVIDNCWMDIYFFSIPRRLVWAHWKEFMGENTTDEWTQTTEYTIPKTEAPEGGWAKGSIADYMGARINTEGIWIDSCYLRAYTLVYNEWFRNENVSEPAAMSMGDATTSGSNGTDYVVDLEKGGMPAQAVKFADYLTRALPEPQKGQPVFVPIGGTAPIIGTENTILSPSYPTDDDLKDKEISFLRESAGNYQLYGNQEILSTQKSIGLSADLTQTTAGATIGQLREAYAVQKLMETWARGGTRYIENIRSNFGITSPDARQQRPEYIGGTRIPINMTEVVQQSETNQTPMGDTAGKSLTIDSRNMVSYASTEHSIILGLMVIRCEHTYQQNIERLLHRQTKYDFYWPALSNISEQPIFEYEIFAQGTADDDDVFGYQEAWADYRYAQNRISGELNSDYAQPLDMWHYGDDYTTAPTLSDEWIKEPQTNLARTLAVQDQDQFICDFYFDQTWVRPMPVYSVPGLTGWH